MHRRDLLRLLGAAALLPGIPRTAEAALAFGRAAHRAARAAGARRALSPEQDALVTCVTELIVPRTDTPGATDVGVTDFIDHLLAAWFPREERDHILAGLADLDRRAGGRFVDQTAEQQAALLTALDGAKGNPGTAEAVYARLKSLTVYAWFTSEQVIKEVTKDPIIPGRFDGCVPLH
jgi:hypothetical protein